MTSNTALTIKVVITLALAAAGISYILYTPPTSRIANYEKRSQNKPSHNVTRESAPKNKINTEASDSISLTGKKGRYEEAQVGKPSN